jgi:hypothetical protein
MHERRLSLGSEPTSVYREFKLLVIREVEAAKTLAQHFRPRRHLLPAPIYRQEMGHRFHTLQEITSATMAA